MRLRITGIGNPSINLQVLVFYNPAMYPTPTVREGPRSVRGVAWVAIAYNPMSAYRPTVSRNLRCSPLSPTPSSNYQWSLNQSVQLWFDPITITPSQARWPTTLFTLAKPRYSSHFRSYRYGSQMLRCGSGLSGALPTVL